MFKRILTIALLAGAMAGVGTSVVQEFTTTPIILHAEEFEGQASAPSQSAVSPTANRLGAKLYFADSGAGEGSEGHEAWGPEDGIERTLYTTLVNVITGVGFGLLLAAAFHLYGGAITGRQGIIWGMAGYATFTLAPALGLPPEVPGTMAADLTARQMWWLFAVGATGLGLALMVFGKSWLLRLAGLLALVVPHAVGAPQPAEIGGGVAPGLAGHFAAASLVTSAIFWALLGWLSGTLQDRFTQPN